jgi:hypothetical protein
MKFRINSKSHNQHKNEKRKSNKKKEKNTIHSQQSFIEGDRLRLFVTQGLQKATGHNTRW